MGNYIMFFYGLGAGVGGAFGCFGFRGCSRFRSYPSFLVVLGILDSLEQLVALAFAGHFPRVSQHNKKPCER